MLFSTIYIKFTVSGDRPDAEIDAIGESPTWAAFMDQIEESSKDIANQHGLTVDLVD